LVFFWFFKTIHPILSNLAPGFTWCPQTFTFFKTIGAPIQSPWLKILFSTPTGFHKNQTVKLESLNQSSLQNTTCRTHLKSRKAKNKFLRKNKSKVILTCYLGTSVHFQKPLPGFNRNKTERSPCLLHPNTYKIAPF
jgi:hypothetical protein